MSRPQKFGVLIAVLLGLLVLLSMVALVCGPAGNLLAGMGGLDLSTIRLVVVELRFPRILLAIVTGFSLAISGVVMQALLRNPLADPFVLGTSAGAANVAVLAIVLGFSGTWVLLGAGFVGALLSMGCVLLIAGVRGHFPVYRLIVSGVIVHSFFSALMMIMISVSPGKISGIMLWLMGSLENKTPVMVMMSAGVVVLGALVLQIKSAELDLLSLGDDLARSSGVNVTAYKLFFLTVSALLTGVVVALSGIIGFIGIIVPHGMRMLMGARHRHLLLLSGLGGALFLLLADTLVRLYFDTLGLPVGVITTMSGAPFFIYLLLRKGREH